MHASHVPLLFVLFFGSIARAFFFPFRYSPVLICLFTIDHTLNYHSDGTKSVPGCKGDGIPDVDYCIKDPDEEEEEEEDDTPSNLGKDFDQLKFLGDNFQGHGKCSGDCDDDDDCKGNLKCFKREDDEDVPGCGDGSDGNDGADYCYDPDDEVVIQEVVVVVPPVVSTDKPTDKPTGKPTNKPTDKPSKSPTTAKPTMAPSRKPSSLAPTSSPIAKAVEETDSPTSDPTLEPTKEPTQAATAVPEPTAPGSDWWGPKDPVVVETSAPTKAPVVVFEPEDIGVNVPPFVVGISFLTPTRRLGAQYGLANRFLLLAENIEKKEVNRIVEQLVEEKMLKKYPETFNDINLRSDFVDETEEDGMTTVAYQFAGQAVFYGDFTRQHQLPQSKDLSAAAIKALGNDALTERLVESGDPILQAAQTTSVGEPEDFITSAADGENTDLPSGSGGVSVGIIILVAVIVGCVLLLGGAFIFIRRQRQKEGNKLISQRPVEEGPDNDLYNGKNSKGALGIDPSPSKTQNTALGDSYEQRSDVGDFSVGYSESHAGESVMDSVMDSSVGRSDWSMMEGGHMASGYSTADDSSFRASGDKTSSGKMGPLSGRRNIELLGTIRALEEVEIPAGGIGQGDNEAGSIAESSLDDNASALGDVKVSNVLQVDEVDTHTDNEDFKKVWRASSTGSTAQQQQQSSATSFDPKTMYQRDDDDDSDAQPKGKNAEETLQEMIGVLNPVSAVPIAAGTTAQDNTIDTISEAPSADDEQSQSGGSIIGSILGMINGQPDKKDDDSIESEPSEEGEDEAVEKTESN